MKIKETAAKIKPEMIEFRRYLHRHPELSFEEVNTSNLVAEELTKLGIDVQRIAKTGIVGTLKGNKPGGTVALRGDMDALPIKEETGLPFTSQKDGVMHACGHDVHTTCLLGAAKILSQLKDEICGTIKFFFQPAEEIAQGAINMINDGALDGVDGIFGMHCSADLQAGTISVDAGSRMTCSDMFTIDVKGQGGHGSAPHQGVDALIAASAIVSNLQTLVSLEFSPLDTVVVHIGKLAAGDRFNIIASNAYMEGTTRCFKREIRKQLPEAIKRIVTNTAAAFRATADVKYISGCPPTLNDERMSAIAKDSIVKLYGEEAVVTLAPTTGAEDFAYYMDKVPGVFALLGICNPELGPCYTLHHSHFHIDEKVIGIGPAVYAQFALDFLAQLQ